MLPVLKNSNPSTKMAETSINNYEEFLLVNLTTLDI